MTGNNLTTADLNSLNQIKNDILTSLSVDSNDLTSADYSNNLNTINSLTESFSTIDSQTGYTAAQSTQLLNSLGTALNGLLDVLSENFDTPLDSKLASNILKTLNSLQLCVVCLCVCVCVL